MKSALKNLKSELDSSMIKPPNSLQRQIFRSSFLLIASTFLFSALGMYMTLHRHSDSQHSVLVPITASKDIQPAVLTALPNTSCSASTAMSIVAHQDDDILFQSPDLLHYIKSGWCVRTIYLTAGDASLTRPYWESREHGAEAAYSTMIGDAISPWITDTVKLKDDEFITVAHPKSSALISLVFLRLPDGNIDGKGFKSTSHESLERLYNGRISTIHSVDSRSQYNSRQLITCLDNLMKSYGPRVVLSQTPYDAGTIFHDHSDHIASGKFTTKALKEYGVRPPLSAKYYTGYPIHGRPRDVFNQDLQAKKATFYAYAKYDGAVCQTDAECDHLPLGAYLSRQYTSK